MSTDAFRPVNEMFKDMKLRKFQVESISGENNSHPEKWPKIFSPDIPSSWNFRNFIYIRGTFNKFPYFFVQTFKIDSWKFIMLLLHILWDDWSIFMISRSNEQQQQQLEYTLLKPDYHSWWISKMQSGPEDTLKEQYAIKFCFKLGKNATETYGML